MPKSVAMSLSIALLNSRHAFHGPGEWSKVISLFSVSASSKCEIQFPRLADAGVDEGLVAFVVRGLTSSLDQLACL